MAYNGEKLSSIDLGRQGENLARTIEIDVSAYLEKWPEADISLLVKRKSDPSPYIADTHIEDGILYWPITAAETELAGDGKIELRVICGNVIAKSATGNIRVVASMTGLEGDVPEPAQSWVNQVLDASREAAKAADQATRTANSLSGITAEAVTLEPGEQATVENRNGVLLYGIPKGLPGKNGVSPTIDLNKSGKQTTLTVTDVTGTKTVVIMDGENGAGEGASALYLTLISEDMETGTMDKPFSEVLNAVAEGKSVYIMLEGLLIPMVGISSGMSIFLLSFPGMGYAMIQYDSDNIAHIEYKDPTAIVSGGVYIVYLSDEMTTDKTYEEVMSALEGENAVFMVYPLGTNGFIFLTPAYMAGDGSLLFVGQYSQLQITILMKPDGTVSAGSNLFDQSVTIQLNQDESTGTFWIDGKWDGTALADEVAIGKSLFMNCPGVGSLPYTGYNYDPASNSVLPVFTNHYWNSGIESMELIQARILSEQFVDPKTGIYGLKVDLIRWKITGEKTIY